MIYAFPFAEAETTNKKLQALQTRKPSRGGQAQAATSRTPRPQSLNKLEELKLLKEAGLTEEVMIHCRKP